MKHHDVGLLERAPFGILIHDGEVIVDVNQAAVRLAGAVHREHLVGQPVHDVLERPYLKSVAQQFVANQPATGPPLFAQERLYGLDGVVRDVESHAQLLVEHGSLMVLVVLRALSDRVQEAFSTLESERQRLQAERMREVQVLAGGVAHEINNALQVVAGYASLLAEQPLSSDQARDVHVILAATARGAAITQRLLEYAQKSPCAPLHTNLGAFVREAVEAYASGMMTIDVAVPTEAGRAAWVMVDRRHLRTMLAILLENASQATLRGGQVTIHVSEERLPTPQLACDGRILTPGTYAVVTVRDSGIGMSLPTQTRMGSPFFSRWPVREGAGMGLSAVQGMLAQNHSFLTFTSSEAKGSAFQLWFPLQSNVPRPPRIDSPPRVLVVQPDPAVRSGVERILRQADMDVLTCRSGEEALEVVAHLGRPSLIVSSAYLPGLSVAALVQQLHRFWTHVPVLILANFGTTLAFAEGSPVHDERELAGWPVVWLRGPVSDFVLVSHAQAMLTSS